MGMPSRGRVSALLVAGAVAVSVVVGACAAGATGDVAAGQAAFTSKGCVGCHGANAEGGVGPKLAGISDSQSQVAGTIRSGKGGGAMPAFNATTVSDQDIANIYAWLQSKK